MRRPILSALLICFAFSVGALQASAQPPPSCVYYQTDPRMEPIDLTDPALLSLAQASALLVPGSSMELQPNDPPTYRLYDTAPWTIIHWGYQLYAQGCSDRDYHGQADVPGASGVLVGRNLVLTAAHNVASLDPPYPTWCMGLPTMVVFGFGNFTSSNQWPVSCDPGTGSCWITIPASDVYTCVDIKYAQPYPGPDWAVIKLDRKVEGREPLPIRRDVNVPPPLDTEMWVVGHPNGIPMKIEPGESTGGYGVDGVHVLMNSSGSMAVAMDDETATWEVVGIVQTASMSVKPACDPPPDTNVCSREWFSNPAAGVGLIPAYLAAAAIP